MSHTAAAHAEGQLARTPCFLQLAVGASSSLLCHVEKMSVAHLLGIEELALARLWRH